MTQDQIEQKAREYARKFYPNGAELQDDADYRTCISDYITGFNDALAEKGDEELFTKKDLHVFGDELVHIFKTRGMGGQSITHHFVRIELEEWLERKNNKLPNPPQSK